MTGRMACAWEIPQPAGESAGFRDDSEKSEAQDFSNTTTTHSYEHLAQKYVRGIFGVDGQLAARAGGDVVNHQQVILDHQDFVLT